VKSIDKKRRGLGRRIQSMPGGNFQKRISAVEIRKDSWLLNSLFKMTIELTVEKSDQTHK